MDLVYGILLNRLFAPPAAGDEELSCPLSRDDRSLLLAYTVSEKQARLYNYVSEKYLQYEKLINFEI